MNEQMNWLLEGGCGDSLQNVSAAQPTWYLQHLHPVQQGWGNGCCGVGSGNEKHLGEVKGHVEIMVCKTVVLFWVQDLNGHIETGR